MGNYKKNVIPINMSNNRQNLSYMVDTDRSFSLLETFDQCNDSMVQNFSRCVKSRMTTLTRQLVSFNPTKMNQIEAATLRDKYRVEIKETERLLKVGQCHPDIIRVTPQIFFIKCNKLL